MSEALVAYQTALQRLEQAKARLESVKQTITTVSQTLSYGWDRLIISNTGMAFPEEVLRDRSTHSINANEWPDARRLASDLNEYHEARFAVRDAYSRIPDNFRAVVQPPPEM